ncbi:RNA polymerase sigma factor [Alteromonas confluentis]|uniref:RNA polymerase subunit sigma-70 n=1 Tax=Alteromonas confluentis TaxID=1656094 RepID=A0A1E7ZEQ2_9ALTE|nr:sigma-70 family RNA polymerase sigma factor [Alteromonas confluentis]OFC71934.1 hypothetical protein BFC18_05700 [Alteromonas confluentis]
MSVQIAEQDVLLAMKGDNNAFTRLIQATRNTISSIALAIVKDLDASEEVAQQVYIQCWQKLNTLKSPSSFLPWLRQSTRYAAFNYLRDNRVTDRVGGDEADLLFSQFCQDDGDSETVLSRSQQAQILARVVDDLPEETREIVLLYYREEQSSAQVATLLSISDASVRQQLSRARQTLKGKLLDKSGALILSTAPTLTISSVLVASAGISSPAQAATVSSASSSTAMKGGLIGALQWIFSGAMLATFAGLIAVYLSAEIPLRRMRNEGRKVALRKERKRTMIGIVITGVLLTAAYEFTSGWVFPIVAYELMMVVIFVQTRKTQIIIAADENTRGKKALSVFGSCSGTFWLLTGITLGNLGMIAGLYTSGRALW